MEISKITKKRIAELLDENIRLDNRKADEYRDIKITFGVSKNAEGSVMVEFGNTKVIAGVKLNALEPFPDTPEEGILITSAELIPLASDEFEPGAPDAKAIELSRIIDRGIRESGFIDFKKLCIKPGEKVWAIYLDIYPINDDGNLLDAAALASVLALKTAVLPKYENDKVLFGEFTDKPLPLVDDKMPILVTVYKINGNLLIDPTSVEEKTVEAGISVAVSFPKNKPVINALQKHGIEPFSIDELGSAFDRAIEAASYLLDIVKKELKKAKTKKATSKEK